MKKSVKSKKQSKRNILITTVCLVVVLAVITAVVLLQRSKSSTVPQATKILPSSKQISAAREARAVAEAYFEAASQCDLEKANSYRLAPKKLPENAVDECKQECPAGLRYSFIKQTADVDRSEEKGVVYEFVNFQYTFDCNGRTYPTILSMIRSSADNTWMVVNSF